ncbi:hypothetical protein EB093_09330, partial [bacterium]|nr:hypothetical protein [bacterium]
VYRSELIPCTTVWTQYLNQPNAYLGIEVKDRTENIGLSVDYSISRGSVSAAIVFGNVPITMVSDSLSGLRFHSSFGEF